MLLLVMLPAIPFTVGRFQVVICLSPSPLDELLGPRAEESVVDAHCGHWRRWVWGAVDDSPGCGLRGRR
eukprot:9796058-Alexandrium_andersonii.AAC.1